MLDWLDDLAVKYLLKRKVFTKIDKHRGSYWTDGFEIKNQSDYDHYVIIASEKDNGLV